MQNKKRSFSGVLVAVWLVLSFIVQAIPAPNASAAGQITSRSLTLLAGPTDGGSKPGGVVKHQFDFTLPTSGSVGSIKFQYCTTAADTGGSTCVAPTGLNTTAAALDSQGVNLNGFTLDSTYTSTNNGTILITRPAANITGPVVAAFTFSSITNPSATNQSFFVRISTYASTDASGSSTDAGTVVGSTATQIVLNGVMPESLVFCTGKTVGSTNGVPDCSSATNGAVDFNALFSATATATASSQMAASTNAGFGYAITVNGNTLTSGANTINPMTSPNTTSTKGISQFGINLKANTSATSNPNLVGQEITPASNGSNYRGQAKTGYDTVDNFQFTDGDTVAASDFGGAAGTDAQIMTVSYIVNVPGSQPAGTYTTTLTYICTPKF